MHACVPESTLTRSCRALDVLGGAGLSELPDPHNLVAQMVSRKLSQVRATLASGYTMGEERFPRADLSLLRGRMREVLRGLPQQQVRGRRVAWWAASLQCIPAPAAASRYD